MDTISILSNLEIYLNKEFGQIYSNSANLKRGKKIRIQYDPIILSNDLQIDEQHNVILNKIEDKNTTTATLFKALLERIQTGGKIHKIERDTLLRSLHFQHDIQIPELAQIFHIKKRQVKLILKALIFSSMDELTQNIKRFQNQQQIQRIKDLIVREIDSQKNLITRQYLREKIKDELDLEIQPQQLLKILKKDLKLKWRRVRSQEAYVNSVGNIKLRRDFAHKLISFLQQGKIFICFDESVIGASTCQNRSWTRNGCKQMRNYRTDMSGLSILLAVSSIGDVHFQFLEGNNNECSVAAFILEFTTHMNSIHPDWRETHLFMLDNCPSHKTPLLMQIMDKLKLPVLFTAPASYLANPVEAMFAAMKYINFWGRPEPDPAMLHDRNIKRLTKKQKMMLNISDYLLGLSKLKLKHVFCKRLQHLESFIRSELV